MLFDVHQDLIKRLMRESHVGKRDVEVTTVALGPNRVVRVLARTEEGLEFVSELEERLPSIDVDDYASLDELEDNPEEEGESEDEEGDDEDAGEDE